MNRSSVLLTWSRTQDWPICKKQIIVPTLKIFFFHINQRCQLHVWVVAVDDDFCRKLWIVEWQREVWFFPRLVHVNVLPFIWIGRCEQPEFDVFIGALFIKYPCARADVNAVAIWISGIRFLTTDIDYKWDWNENRSISFSPLAKSKKFVELVKFVALSFLRVLLNKSDHKIVK